MAQRKFKVAANFDDFLEDHEVIMTIQDRGVLDPDADEEDILENYEMPKANSGKAGNDEDVSIIRNQSFNED